MGRSLSRVKFGRRRRVEGMVMGMAVGTRDWEKRAWVRRSRMRKLAGTGEVIEEGETS
jgi:hypothetical protein